MAQIECLPFEEAEQPWQELSQGAARNDVFQSYHWARFERDVNGVEPLFLLLRDSSRTLGGQVVLQRRVMGLLRGYETAGGPLYVDGCGEEVFQATLEYLDHRLGAANYRMVRPQAPHQQEEALQQRGFRKSRAYTFLLDLTPGEEQLWTSLSRGTRNMVRKGPKVGLEVRPALTWDDWDAFDRMQQQHHGKKGIPALPTSTLRHLFDHMAAREDCVLLSAYLEGKCVAGVIFVVSGKSMLTLAIAADSEALHSLPNEAVMWEAIRWGCNHGIETYDLYDTDPREDSPLYGIHRFKAKWGGELVERSFYIKGRAYWWAREHLNNDGFVRRVANVLRHRKWA